MLTDDLRRRHPSPSPKPSLYLHRGGSPDTGPPPPTLHVLLQTAATVTCLERSLLMTNEARAEIWNEIRSHVASRIVREMSSRLLSCTRCAWRCLKRLTL